MSISASAGPLIEFRGATKRFQSADGSIHTAVENLTFAVDPGEFVAVVGPTGCGKSTTLSLASGLQSPSAGRTLVRGQDVKGIPRNIGYVFQHDAALPWKTVRDNVALGLRFRGIARAEAHDRARHWVNKVGLAGFEDYYPHRLSGGMRKRVALAQTLVTEPEILLMDEPFGALDVHTRSLMHDELLRVWSEIGCTVIFVTHDLEEAITVADRVVVMTASPATVCGDFVVGLDRPRCVEKIRLTEQFRTVYSEIWLTLRHEVHAAREKAALGAP